MGQYRIFSEPLGVDFMVEGSEAPNAESTFQILKQVVPPDRMIKAFEDGNKELARAAYKNGYFDQESDTSLYDAFKQAAGEVMEGLGDISKEVSLDFTASGAMTYGVPGSQKLVEGARAEQQKRRRKRKATGYQTMAEVFAGYKTIGDAGKLAFSKIAGEGDEDIDASIQFIGDMMKTQSFIDDGAAIMAEQFGDFDMYRDLKAGRVEPDKKQALAASLFVQLENPVAAVTTGGIRSTTNMLRRGTAKKLAEQFKEANSKKFLLEKQLNRLPANASDKLVKTATDALEKATKESDEILAKITPFTEQKAKAGFTNQMVGKGMQAVGKAGEHFGNLTEFIRRAGVEEATTLLMRAGMTEPVAKGVIYTAIGGVADISDGDLSATGTGFGALAAYMGPRAIASMGRSTAILGKQLTMAETTMPFFKRVGALPADDPKLAEVLVDRTDNLVLGDAASQLKPILTQTRDLPSTVRGAARFIDRSGLGRLGTETANVAKAAAGGAALPGAFGYMAGGEEGAASAIGASAPFIAAGLGYGSLLRFNNKSDLLAKQLGDLEYHKQSLTETERTNFEKLDKDQQVAISTFSQFFPDVEIRMKSMGKDGPSGAHYVDGSDSVIEINTDTNLSYGTILSHEIGHHIERHGLLPNILEEMLGNPEKGRVGIFTKIDKSTGKPKITTDENGMKHYELTDEFRELQKAYVDKLANSNVSEKAKQAYETPEQFARELFAETVAERMLSGKTSKRAGQSSTYKLIESLGDRITSGGFMRKAMHSLGMATKADGSLVQGTGILGKPFKTSKQLDNLVKRYEDETIGLSESEIREQRPVTKDDELDTVIVSPSDPIESLQVFNNGGHFKTDKDGNIIVNPITKKPEVYSPSETKKANQALARDLTESIKARENDLPEGHVTLSETEDGKFTGSGKFIDDSIIDELSRTGRYNPSQINFLREASKAGREGIGNQMLLFYYAATGKGGRKYKTLKGGYRDSLVYGITITKDGNVILDTVSLDKLQKNIDYLLKRRGNEIGQAFGGSDPAVIRKNFESMFEKYLDNHAKGIVNGTPESGITEGQKNFLNAAFGPVSKSQIADNPTLSNLGERRANTLGTYRSRRLDRIGTIQPTGNTRNIVIDRIRRNLMPGRGGADKLFIPAYHGTPHTFAPEPGAPFGKFRTSAIGTGEGAQAYGHGLYFAGKKEVAEHYRNALGYDPDKMKINGRQINDEYNRFAGNPKATNLDYQIAEGIERLMMNESPQDVISYFKENDFDPRAIKYFKDAKFETYGSLYKVELAPKENEYLLYDKTLGEQTKDIQDKLRKVLTELEGEDLWEYRKDLDYRDITDNALENVPEPEISRRLKEAGIPGIKYLDGSSRSKGEGDYNYVIFDEADVQITDKLFMPASEAGAGKGKQAEAAKLWQEKGTDSPYFKKWFGKSKVVDENGEPLVVYHGTPEGGFSEFDLSKSGKSGDPGLRGKGFYFADSKYLAERYKDAPRNTKQEQAGQVYEVYLNIKNPYDAKANPLKVNFSNPEQSTKILKDKGFDGVIFKYGTGAKEIVAFSPEQIKSATGNRGTFDAGERNILFMPAGGDKLTATHNLSAEALAKADELGGLPVPSVGITKGRALEGFGEVTLLGTRPLVDPELGVPAFGSDVYSKRFPREKYKPVKMKKADDFVAKYKPFANETGGHELSLIFEALVNSPDLGDAKWRFMSSDFAKMAFLKDKGKPIRVPKKKESVDAIVDQQLVNEVSGLAKLYENIRFNDPEWKQYSKYLRDAFNRSDLAKKDKVVKDLMLENLFDKNNLANVGPGNRILMDIRKFGNMVIDKSKLRDRIEKKFTKNLKAEYEKWATQEIASLFDDPYIVVDGKKVPLTLDTATDSMTGRIRAVEKNMTFGPGEARSMGSPKFSNIQEMRNRSDVLVSKEKFDSYKENIQDPVHEAFRESAMQAYKYSDGWTSLDLSYRALGQYLQSFKGSSKQRMRSALRKYDFIPNDSLVEKAIKAAEVLRDAPTEYFEAKPQRAVKLEEFAGAIIPKKANPKVKELADKYGWEVKTYDPNKPETRQTAVRQLANRLQRQGKEVLFMPSDSKAPKRQPANRITRQAPAMPGNRFMLPAVSAGAKSAERFR